MAERARTYPGTRYSAATVSRYWRQWVASRTDLPDPSLYIGLAAALGGANIVLNLVMGGLYPPLDWFVMVTVLILCTLIPAQPVPACLAYLACWGLVVSLPQVHATDMILTNFVFFFLVGRLFTPNRAAALIGAFFTISFVSATLQGLSGDGVKFLVVYTSFASLLTPVGSIVRSIDDTRRKESQRAAADAKQMRLSIAREMHDLVAYSMSQTALRAKRAAVDPSYPQDAREEFAALESTAADALHELRLLLRALRNATPDLGQPIGTTTGLGGVVTDLACAVQALSDDVAAAGFDVTYRCVGNVVPHRLQASTLSRVAREMGANIIRHGDPRFPVTLTLTLGDKVTRLVSTNKIRATSSSLPRSGSGVLGMRERLEAVDGTLTTLADNGSWITTATVPSFPVPITSALGGSR